MLAGEPHGSTSSANVASKMPFEPMPKSIFSSHVTIPPTLPAVVDATHLHDVGNKSFTEVHRSVADAMAMLTSTNIQ